MLPNPKRRRLDNVTSTDTNSSPQRSAETARSTLSKPFKSPLKHSTDPAAASAVTTLNSPSDGSHKPSPGLGGQGAATAVDALHGSGGTARIAHSRESVNDSAHPDATVQATSRTRRSAWNATRSGSSTSHPQPPSRHRPINNSQNQTQGQGPMALSNTIRALRSDLDVLSQATKLLTSSSAPPTTTSTSITSSTTPTTTKPPPTPQSDTDLLALTTKWRTFARLAAEEVYASTRDKVNRMGGVGAWRARERERVSRVAEWERESNAPVQPQGQDDDDEDEEESEDDDDDDEEGKDGKGQAERGMSRQEKKELKRLQRKAVKEARQAADSSCRPELEEAASDERGRKQDEGLGALSGGADDDDFTIGMMLRTLNIDSDILGYSAVEQRWVD